MSNLKVLRIVAYLEGISFLLLLGIGVPLKYMYAIPLPNMIFGMTHGVLFMAYIAWVYFTGVEHKWKIRTFAISFIAGLLPFGTFVADARIFKQLSN